jgi:hypothetical protein
VLKRIAVLVALLTLLAQGTAWGATIFSDNFDTENGGQGQLNFNGFDNFTILFGTVDLIGDTPSGTPLFDLVPGNGLYVDLDGSTSNSGLMLADLMLLGAGSYELSFDLAGSHRGTTESVLVSLLAPGAFALQTFTLPSDQAFTSYSIPFTTTGGGLLFAFQGAGNDNIGLLLDRVTIQRVAEPATVALFGLALLGLGFSRRKRAAT